MPSLSPPDFHVSVLSGERSVDTATASRGSRGMRRATQESLLDDVLSLAAVDSGLAGDSSADYLGTVSLLTSEPVDSLSEVSSFLAVVVSGSAGASCRSSGSVAVICMRAAGD